MTLIVQKYGGTSVGSPERIEHVAEKVMAARARGQDVIVVLSAMSGETDRLVGLAHKIDPRPAPRELDVLLATGELVFFALLSLALENRGSKARIRDIVEQAVRKDLAAGRVVVVAGFQGVDEEGNITTLGRGGSDTTAVALAAALKADECQIYTDVAGVYTTAPRVVPNARRLNRITFEEMLELASLGSKVLQIRTVEFAGKYIVPLRVLSSFQEGEVTLISLEEAL